MELYKAGGSPQLCRSRKISCQVHAHLIRIHILDLDLDLGLVLVDATKVHEHAELI